MASPRPFVHTVRAGESLSTIAPLYNLTWQQLRDANKSTLLAAQRTYCSANTLKSRCTGLNKWGGGTPAGCCPDEKSFSDGWINVDLLPIGTPLTIPGKYQEMDPPPYQPPYQPPPKPPTDFKSAGTIFGALLVGYGLYRWWEGRSKPTAKAP